MNITKYGFRQFFTRNRDDYFYNNEHPLECLSEISVTLLLHKRIEANS